MRLNHVTLPAIDVEASAEFYRRLGLTQIVASYPKYARFVAEGGVTLSLHLDEAAVPSGASVHFATRTATASPSSAPARCA
ncbi:MAG: bifunctional hydroxymethylpyrimidine kinase/phosphomethylpyrimidine kinase [Solirubrobacterales bacterium]|nr:bifunctional hydroxymethylpyrimidine kinase/phosphomethylpyrimidine kinase [Solirubrobacterales bacterium]